MVFLSCLFLFVLAAIFSFLFVPTAVCSFCPVSVVVCPVMSRDPLGPWTWTWNWRTPGTKMWLHHETLMCLKHQPTPVLASLHTVLFPFSGSWFPLALQTISCCTICLPLFILESLHLLIVGLLFVLSFTPQTFFHLGGKVLFHHRVVFKCCGKFLFLCDKTLKADSARYPVENIKNRVNAMRPLRENTNKLWTLEGQSHHTRPSRSIALKTEKKLQIRCFLFGEATIL